MKTKRSIRNTLVYFAEDEAEAQEKEDLIATIQGGLVNLDLERLRRLAAALEAGDDGNGLEAEAELGGEEITDDGVKRKGAHLEFDENNTLGQVVDRPGPREEPSRADALRTGGYTVKDGPARPSAAGGADYAKMFAENERGLRQLGIDSPEKLRDHLKGKKLAERHFLDRTPDEGKATMTFAEKFYDNRAKAFNTVGVTKKEFLRLYENATPAQRKELVHA